MHLDSVSSTQVKFTGVMSLTCGRDRLWTPAGCVSSTTFNAFVARRILGGFHTTAAYDDGIMFVERATTETD